MPEILEKSIVQEATETDIPGIITCMNANLFHNLNDKQQGRLYYPTSDEELSNIIDSPNHILLCVKKGNDVIGYVLSYNLKEWIFKKPTRMDNIQVAPEIRQKFETEKVLYGRHIAVHPDYRNSGLGGKLIMNSYNKSLEQGYTYIVGEIMREPMSNSNSMGIHQRVGFETIGEIAYEDGTIWDLIGREI